MWTSRQYSTGVVARPSIASMPRVRAGAVASVTAAVVSWSVTVMTVSPALAARSTSSAGVQRPSDAIVCRWRSIMPRGSPIPDPGLDPPGSPRGRAMRGGRLSRHRLPAAPLPLHERTVFAHQQVEVGAFLVGELEEDLLALRVIEALAVLLEEAVRVALAADADEQGLLIVDAAQEPVGPFGEQAVRRALEEEERRPRFELRVALEQLAVTPFELAEVLLLLPREILEHLGAARIAGDARRARVELETAALGRNRNPQRVARKQQVGVAGLRRAVASGPALFARAVNLHDTLRGAEAARGRHLLDQRFDVRAEELERSAAGLADQMEVPRLAVGVLEAEAAFAEIDLAGDAGVHHPLHRPVDGCAADALIFAANQVDEVVGAEMSFLAQEHVDDLFPLARPLAAVRLQPAEIRNVAVHRGTSAAEPTRRG